MRGRVTVAQKEARDEVYHTKLKAVALTPLSGRYKVMHLSMMYDGAQAKEISDVGFRLAKTIIDRCKKLLPAS